MREHLTASAQGRREKFRLPVFEVEPRHAVATVVFKGDEQT